MEPNTEVKELMTRFYEAMSRGDFGFLDGLVSRRPGFLWIGTDPGEWWEDPKVAFKDWQAQVAAQGPSSITAGNVTAYQHGDVAWAADRPTFHLPDGRKLPFRFTVVWVREGEGWRIVQIHTSFGVANEAVLRSK